MMMQTSQVSTEQLLLEIANLRQEIDKLRGENTDLELLLETTTTHADTIEIQLYESNKKLQSEIVERQRAEALLKVFSTQLQSLVEIVSKEKSDLEILLETTTEHGDLVGEILHDQAEETLRQSERLLAQFLEALPVGVGILDANGKPYYGNRIAKQILGKKCVPEAYQVYQAGTNQLYPSDQLPGMRALKGESTSVDDLEIHQGNKIIPVEAWGTPIYNQQGNIAYAIVAFQDISKRKWIESECKKFNKELYQINETLSRFVPRQFLQFLNKESIVDVQIGDHVQKEMSVLFADIRDFTTLSEQMTPQENFNFINAYFSRMEPAISENQGFIDKYIGDEIMALFNGGADNAVKAGISMLHKLNEYNHHRDNCGYLPVKIGIGINTGSLMLGTVGGASRMDSTVISDAVNLASRIERLTKDFGVSLLISHHTFLQLKEYSEYSFRLIERLKVRGKSKSVSVYEVFDADLPKIYEGKLATKQEFEQALLLYNLRSFKEAAQLFKHCLCINPKDTVAQIYLKRCKERMN